MDADILLLRLYHPNTFLPHSANNAKYVDVIGYQYLLQYPVESDESSAPPDTGAAMNNDRALVGPNAFPERADESREGLRRTWHPEIGPRCEVKVLDDAFNFTLKLGIDPG